MKRLGFVLLLVCWPAAAEQATDCARIDDRDERLACFDRLFPGAERARAAARSESLSGAEAVQSADADAGDTGSGESPMPTPEPPAGTQPPAAHEDAVVGADGAADREPSTAGPVPAKEPDPVRERGLFDDPRLDFTSTIVAIRRGEKQRMVFLLANEEIWMQAKPRPLPFREGDTVRIRSATLGGYFMRSSQGTGTRVRRIQ